MDFLINLFTTHPLGAILAITFLISLFVGDSDGYEWIGIFVFLIIACSLFAYPLAWAKYLSQDLHGWEAVRQFIHANVPFANITYVYTEMNAILRVILFD